MRPLAIEQLRELECFLDFTRDYDFLKLSLTLQERYSQDFNWENSLFAEPIGLNPFFPQLKGKLELLDQGVLLLAPNELPEDATPMAFSVGLHGNETGPIEVVNQLLSSVLRGQLTPKGPTLFLFGHFEAMLAEKRQIEENLNRCFDPHRPLTLVTRSQESIRAYRLKLALDTLLNSTPIDPSLLLHLDLHTAIRKSMFERFVVYPYRPQSEELTPKMESFLATLGVQAVLHSDGPTSTFAYYSTQKYNALGLTVELGKVRPFGKNNLQDFDDVRLSLENLITKGLAQEFPLVQLDHFDVVRTLTRQHQDFKLLFPEDLPNFSTFKAGQPLMQDGEKIFHCHDEQERIVFPNSRVAIGERAALIVRPK